QWWSDHPDANIAVRCGAGALSVLECDATAGDTVRKLRDAGVLDNMIAQVRTPDGGSHFYFDHAYAPAPLPRRFDEAGVRVLGEGALVMVWPSVIMLNNQPAGYEVLTVQTPPSAEAGLDWEALVRVLDP